MKIIVDHAMVKADLPWNGSLEKAVARHERQCALLGEWCGADEVEYSCGHKTEGFTIRKSGKSLHLAAIGTPLDGAWFDIKEK